MAQSRRVRGAAAGGKTRRLGSGGCLCAHWAETGGVLPSASPGTEGEEAGRKPHVCKNAGPPEAEGSQVLRGRRGGWRRREPESRDFWAGAEVTVSGSEEEAEARTAASQQRLRRPRPVSCSVERGWLSPVGGQEGVARSALQLHGTSVPAGPDAAPAWGKARLPAAASRAGAGGSRERRSA